MRITDVTDDAGSEWYPDSGATSHVTNSTRHLQKSQPYHGGDTVMIGDVSYLPIKHTGSTVIGSSSGKLPLNDVVVCPQIAKSMLSVSKVTADYPCSVKFDNIGVRVKDKNTNTVLTTGRKLNGLYRLESKLPIKALYSSRQRSASDEVCHRRLGHLHQQLLQHFSANKLISISSMTKRMCASCQLGKSSRLPFQSSSFVAKRPLEMVHCDLGDLYQLCQFKVLDSM